MNTIWRKPQSNLAPRGNLPSVVVIRRAASGFVWRLMVYDQQVAAGGGRTQLACRDAARKAKATLTGAAGAQGSAACGLCQGTGMTDGSLGLNGLGPCPRCQA